MQYESHQSPPQNSSPEPWSLVSDAGTEPSSQPEDAGTSPSPDVRGQCFIFCPRCGASTSDSREFCVRCGSRRCVGCGE